MAQWQEWSSGPRQPRKRIWPPGEVDTLAHGDRRNCVDCHMRSVAGVSGDVHVDHRWAARRNLGLLQEGIHVRSFVRPEVGGQPRLIVLLTNTSGHAYPTGTCRRTLELLIASGDGQESVAAKLGLPYPDGSTSSQLQRPLEPGEQRELNCALPPGAESVRYRLRYVRDRLNPQRYRIDIAVAEQICPPWPQATAFP